MRLPLSVRSALIFAFLLRIACSAGIYVAVSNLEAAVPSAQQNSRLKTVIMNHFKFEPDDLAVDVGDTVEWKNLDIVPHTATAADPKTFDSGPIAKGGSWRFVPRKKGTYDYLCTLHPNMHAKVTVR